MTAKTLMIQGTMSSAGKSLLVTALCRVFARRGVRVAPFKAQNMSNNAAVCLDGGEIGRAQYTQALAANIQPTIIMNPVLLKPEADSCSQVIVMGRPWQTISAQKYYQRKRALWEHVTQSLDTLCSEYDLVIIEGAGSPVELNLKQGDIVNMAVARYANAPVLLAGDIDRGGIFAQLLGTLWLFEPEDRVLVKGFIVNKFRGDMNLFTDGIAMLEQQGNVPVVGVVPHIHDLAIPEEDAVAVEGYYPQSVSQSDVIDIVVIRLPRIANFDDFDPLLAEPNVQVRYVSDVRALGKPDAIILPGTKSTLADLDWLRRQGLDSAIRVLAEQGTAVVGICGGYQMLGEVIRDPEHVESMAEESAGLSLLPIETTFAGDKATYQAQAQIIDGMGWLRSIVGEHITGYEIHMGRTTLLNETETALSWLTITERNMVGVQVVDGAVARDGGIWGCYLHGLFANPALRHAWLASLGWQPTKTIATDLEAAFDHLADTVESALDMALVEDIIGF